MNFVERDVPGKQNLLDGIIVLQRNSNQDEAHTLQ